MSTSKTKRKFPVWPVVIGLGAMLLCGGAVVLAPRFLPTPPGGANGTPAVLKTGAVVALTAISSVESSGPTIAQQETSVFWEMSGLVLTVSVKPGDRVPAGALLMALDPRTAPQSVLQAHTDIFNAQQTLADLREPPTALALAQAAQAIVNAEDQLAQAQKALQNLQSKDLSYYEEQVTNAQEALEQAKRGAIITDLGEYQTAVTNATNRLTDARNRLQDLQGQNALYPGCCDQRIQDAQEAVTQAENDLTVAQLRLEQAQNNNINSVEDAQQALEDAQNNLAAARRSPDALKVALAEAKVQVAQATLTDAQDKLADLQDGPDPADIQAAELRIQMAEKTLAQLELHSPIAGEVLAVSYQVGDRAGQTQAAVIIANRDQQYVNASVDESEIGLVVVGQPVSVTFDALPDVALNGTVDWINPVGATTQGLVKYTVRIALTSTDPRVLLGMTANTRLIVQVQENALAVPLDAVQLDAEGEFVNRVTLLGTTERVNVVSGEVQEDLVIVTGDLRPGDQVQLIEPVPTNSGSPFGP